MKGNVIVVGGGIAGIQTSTDLANMGFDVYLVERESSIGGRMAQLDKTFPTNDCSICILAPKMIDCYQHPNVHTLVCSEIVEMGGELGNFKVKVLRKPTYVDWSRCTGCGECTEKCPTKVENEFNMRVNRRRAIYFHFLQAVPKKACIDSRYCRFLTTGKCKVCEKTCKAKAIDFTQKERIEELNVGAIVVATGFDFYDVSAIKEYGYGKLKNVVTAMEFERIICASGPTGGHLLRPSDIELLNAMKSEKRRGAEDTSEHKHPEHPKRIAFIQCVGSRDFKHRNYCSAVCCMHATKEAILANEHHSDIKSYIFYMDMRAVGKKFQDYIERAKREYNVTYIRSRPGRVTEAAGNKNPIIWYEETTTRKLKSLEVELVVLSQALVPAKGAEELAKLMGLSINENGFFRTADNLRKPIDTEREGIFAVGYCQSPQDIPECVAQASGAAARVAEVLASRTGGK